VALTKTWSGIFGAVSPLSLSSSLSRTIGIVFIDFDAMDHASVAVDD
jgi:hypothetical protein